MIARPNFRPFCTGMLSVSQLVWSPDGQFFASGGDDGIAHIWCNANSELLSSFAHGQAVERRRWSPDSARMAAMSREVVHVWPLPLTMAAAAA